MMPLSQITPLLARGWQTHCANPGEVAITFDDGPDPATTPKLLKVLDQLEIKATMFVIGQKCRGNKELLKEVAAAGHTLACHGYSHERHWFRDASFVQGSIRQTVYMLQDCGLRMEPMFRPPFGAIDWKLHKRVSSLGVVPVLWSTHVADWKPQDSETLRQRMVSVVHDRMILLLHDGQATSGDVVQQLPYLNYEIQRRGFHSIALKAIPKAESAVPAW